MAGVISGVLGEAVDAMVAHMGTQSVVPAGKEGPCGFVVRNWLSLKQGA
jgi:hypothetical protein